MKKYLLFLFVVFGQVVYANENKVEIESDVVSVPSCIFSDGGQGSDGVNVYQKISFSCSDEVSQNLIFYSNNKPYKGVNSGGDITFKIEINYNLDAVFSKYFLIVY